MNRIKHYNPYTDNRLYVELLCHITVATQTKLPHIDMTLKPKNRTPIRSSTLLDVNPDYSYYCSYLDYFRAQKYGNTS